MPGSWQGMGILNSSRGGKKYTAMTFAPCTKGANVPALNKSRKSLAPGAGMASQAQFPELSCTDASSCIP
jgi:hypothetical protein